ncbi:MAG: glycosyltransferase family 4 protein [Candidatus Omnitrophica bacterium]|nr:glycosyltransferase family 4 protein [Candidatus Omnitrophota bacterium]
MQQTIAIIAERAPLFRQHSGDRRLMELVRIMARTHKVVYLSTTKHKDKSDEPAIDEMKDLGIEVYTETFALREVLSRPDLAFVFIEFFFIAEYFLPRIRILNKNARVVVDSVDIHYCRELSQYELTKKKEDYEKALQTRKREAAVYNNADVVLTLTPEDTKFLLKDFPGVRTHVIPNIHDIEPVDFSKRREKTLIFVGGFYHTPNVDAMHFFCQEVMPLLAAQCPDIKLKIIGSNVPGEIRRYANENIEVIGFVPSVSEHLQQSYISVAPLRYGAGMKGKVGEALAHGIPVVTTSFGIQGMELEPGKDVMLAQRPEEYVSRIMALINDRKLYEEMSHNGMRFIRERYTPDAVSRMMDELYEETARHPAKRLPAGDYFAFWKDYLGRRIQKICARK